MPRPIDPDAQITHFELDRFLPDPGENDRPIRDPYLAQSLANFDRENHPTDDVLIHEAVGQMMEDRAEAAAQDPNAPIEILGVAEPEDVPPLTVDDLVHAGQDLWNLVGAEPVDAALRAQERLHTLEREARLQAERSIMGHPGPPPPVTNGTVTYNYPQRFTFGTPIIYESNPQLSDYPSLITTSEYTRDDTPIVENWTPPTSPPILGNERVERISRYITLLQPIDDAAQEFWISLPDDNPFCNPEFPRWAVVRFRTEGNNGEIMWHHEDEHRWVRGQGGTEAVYHFAGEIADIIGAAIQ